MQEEGDKHSAQERAILEALGKVQEFLSSGGDISCGTDKKACNCLVFYKRHCMDMSLSPKLLYKLLRSLYGFEQAEARDILVRWEAAIGIVDGEMRDTLLSAFVMVCRSDMAMGIRLYIPEMFYDAGVLTDLQSRRDGEPIPGCNSLCMELIQQGGIDLVDELECCKYLYLTENSDYFDMIHAALTKLVASTAFDSEEKLLLLSQFASNEVKFRNRGRGIRTTIDMLMMLRLYHNFFFSTEDTKSRLVAAAFLLAHLAGQEQESIETELFLIGQDATLAEGVRAEALDTVARLGKRKQEASALLREMGWNASRLSFKTFYDSSQTTHHESIEQSVDKAVERLLKEVDVGTTRLTVWDVATQIESHMSKLSSGRDRFKVKQAINRIMSDNTLYSSSRATLSEILVAVWTYCGTLASVELLRERLLQELVDVPDNCGSRFVSGMLNTLHGQQDTGAVWQVVSITYREQLRANIQGRFFALTRDQPEDVKAAVAMGMMEDASPEDKSKYTQFVLECREGLYNELKREFVGSGYIEQEQFQEWFELEYFPDVKLKQGEE